MDSAGWHTTKKLIIPENITIMPLPPYSPELNPTEHIWDYIREQKHFNNYSFNYLRFIENHLCSVPSELQHEKELIKSLCYFNWIKNASC